MKKSRIRQRVSIAVGLCAVFLGCVSVEAGAAQPVTARAEAAKPTATKPALAKPAAAKSAVAKPALAKPAAGAKKVRDISGEALYNLLSTRKKSEAARRDQLALRLSLAARGIDWKKAEKKTFDGHLRKLRIGEGEQAGDFFLIRATSGEVYIVALPADAKALKKGSSSHYADLANKAKSKMKFVTQTRVKVVDGVKYHFLKFAAKPKRLLLDRLFFIAIVILLFMTMVGMGLTLTLKDFALVFKKPLGMIIGPICQFGLMPLLAMILGRLAGFYDTYPFIFLGMILIAATPGGVTSNLMTYLGKGDVALSVSLTAVCTVLALFFTPLLLTLYGAGIPAFKVPVGAVFKQILILVIVPLFVGMLVRGKFEKFAKRAEKPFAMLGVVSLLFLIVVGVWSNVEKFGDTSRYGVKFYLIVFALTLAGMVFAALIAKLFKVNNYQTRAISLECGLRNASLAMTIALLLQDLIGDFYSSMFFTSGIFGVFMYFAGAFSIYLFKRILPVEENQKEVA